MELRKNDFREVEGLFHSFRYHISVKGVIEGVVPGRIFTDEKRKAAVAISPQGIFLGGDLQNESFFSKMNGVMNTDILPKYREEGELDYVVFYPQEEVAEKALDIMLHNLSPMKSMRMIFSKDMNGVDTVLQEGIVEVRKELLSKTDIEGMEGIIEEISKGWSSIEDFLAKGFGTAAVQDNKILGWCLTDWVVGEECEIGIETYPEYRRQGLGRKMAVGTLALAKKRGIKRTGWQCWADNSGSIATAKSVGFKLLWEFPVLFAWVHELDNMLINGNYYMLGRKNLNISPDYCRSACSYQHALEKGWDWGGYSVLYWNCACMLYKIGQKDRARHYYELALQKGWKGIEEHLGNPYVYTEADSVEILKFLGC